MMLQHRDCGTWQVTFSALMDNLVQMRHVCDAARYIKAIRTGVSILAIPLNS